MIQKLKGHIYMNLVSNNCNPSKSVRASILCKLPIYLKPSANPALHRSKLRIGVLVMKNLHLHRLILKPSLASVCRSCNMFSQQLL